MSILTTETVIKIETKASNAKVVLQQAEAEIIRAVIKASRYNQSRAAVALGVSRGTFRKLLETHFPGEYIGKNSTAKKGRPV